MSMTTKAFETVGRMLSKNYGIRVIQAGNECKTDGKTIFIPNIPAHIDNPRLLGMVRAFLDHEVGHIIGASSIETKKMVGRKYGAAGEYVLNILEDVRIEALMAEAWAGCNVNLKHGMDAVLEQHAADTPEMAEERKNPLKQVAIDATCRSKGMETPAWVPPEARQLVDRHAEQIVSIPQWAERTTDLVPLVEAIMADLQPPTEETPPQPQDQEGQGGGGSGGKADKSDAGKGQSDVTEAQKETERAEQEAQQVQDGDGSPDKADDEPGDDSSPAGKDASDGEQDAQPGSGGQSESTELGEPEPTESTDGEPSDGYDLSAGDPEKANAQSEPLDITERDIEAAAEDGGLTEQLAKQIADVIDEASSKDFDAWCRPLTEGMDSFRDYMPESKSNTDQFRKDAERAGGASRQKLAQLLQTEARVWWRGGQPRGIPDPRRMAALAIGTDDRVMRRRFEARAADTACYLLMDGSGSMQRKCYNAAKAAYAFGRVLDLCGHASYIGAFVGVSWGPTDGIANANRELYDAECSAGRHHPLGASIMVAKTWREPFRQCLPKLTQYALHGAIGGTPLGEAIMAAAREVADRPEKRKVIVAFTDGQADASVAKAACRNAERAGIETCLIGLGESADRFVKAIHHRTAHAEDGDLDRVVMKELTKALHPIHH